MSSSEVPKKIQCIYFCPEDGESVENPNSFFLQASTISMSDVRRHLPLEGTYHLRYGVTSPVLRTWVWLDKQNEKEELPLSESGRAYIKITRVSWSCEKPLSEKKSQLDNTFLI